MQGSKGQIHGKSEVNGKVKCKDKASGQEKSKKMPNVMMQAGGEEK